MNDDCFSFRVLVLCITVIGDTCLLWQVKTAVEICLWCSKHWKITFQLNRNTSFPEPCCIVSIVSFLPATVATATQRRSLIILQAGPHTWLQSADYPAGPGKRQSPSHPASHTFPQRIVHNLLVHLNIVTAFLFSLFAIPPIDLWDPTF